jgi:MFS family permease
LALRVEWYDFFIYATASSLVFNKLFFPNLPPLVGTLVSFGTYAAGFFARPVGGRLFGYIGDRFGCKSALVTTPLIVGIATFVIWPHADLWDHRRCSPYHPGIHPTLAWIRNWRRAG